MPFSPETCDLPVVSLAVAEPGGAYEWRGGDRPSQWVDVLVDLPGEDRKLWTYAVPPDLLVRPGDILSVPFGSQQLGAIAVATGDRPPPDLDPEAVKAVEDVVVSGFFPASYWALLERVAAYYYTPLIQVIKTALPPGLLGKSQRRIRLSGDIPKGAEVFCTPAARQILELLGESKTGDYSWIYLRRQVPNATRGLHELSKKGWVESYLEPPKPPRAKLQKAVTFVGVEPGVELTDRQHEVLEVLRRRGGELWLTELQQTCHTSSGLIQTLESKGCVEIDEREVLRTGDRRRRERDRPKSLTNHQESALTTLNGLRGFNRVLLHGVTGSGKTEVYLQAIAPILDRGASAIVLVPEIGLTPQLCDRFRARFGDKVLVYHSGLSDGERYDSWRQMLAGSPQIVIGTRSAIFAPLPKLGAIVLDEEYDDSYKQDRPSPTYHARTVAEWRAELADCLLILGSATPSLETWVDYAPTEPDPTRDRYRRRQATVSPAPTHYLSLPERIHGRALPPVEVVDMRQEFRKGNKSIFSESLQAGLIQLVETGQQGILFIHRRGHSSFVSCRSCGYVMECPHCDVSLSYHHTHEAAAERLRCHYCGYSQSPIDRCPDCHSPYFKHFGSGTQRVTQALAKQFPELRVIRFDSDTTRTKDAHRILLTRFANKEADLLVGTQMLTKGLDIPQVTLVGVVAADGLLNLCDYRAAERAFQTLTQVVGRAGRGGNRGRAVIQTYNPDHPAIEAVRRQQYEAFIQAELETREALHYPPYGRLILLRVSGMDEATVCETIAELAHMLQPEPGWEDIAHEVLGPSPAPIARVSNRYRWQLLLKFPPWVPVHLPRPLEELRSRCPHTVRLAIDVDPLNLG
jgi:primosomal protein N' (replication factor Y)